MAKWSDICTKVDTCALTGAAAFFTGVKDAQMIVNGPNWCYFYTLRHIEKADFSINNRFHCTQLNNEDIVYGTEDVLLDLLNEKSKKITPSVLLVENSCAAALIGDDIKGIVRKSDFACPIVCIDSGGLAGGFCEGYVKAAQGYLEQLPLDKSLKKEAKTVNLIGCTYNYYNSRNDLAEIKRILHLAGYKVQAAFGAGSSVEEISQMTKAQLNIVIYPELGLKIAQQLEEEYSIPFVVPDLPYGLEGSKKWLEVIKIDLNTDLSKVFSEIEESEQMLFSKINEYKSIWGDLWFDNALVAGYSSVAFSIAKALRLEWADMQNLSVVFQDEPLLNYQDVNIDNLYLANKDGVEVENLLKSLNSALLLASSSETSVVRRQKLKNVINLNINYPVYDELLLIDKPFIGIKGHAHMLQRLWNAKIKEQLLKNS